MDFTLYTSQPAPLEKRVDITLQEQQEPTCNIPKSDNDTLRRQACMFTASGEVVCDDSRRDGQGMIVKQSNPAPMGYSF